MGSWRTQTLTRDGSIGQGEPFVRLLNVGNWEKNVDVVFGDSKSSTKKLNLKEGTSHLFVQGRRVFLIKVVRVNQSKTPEKESATLSVAVLRSPEP